MRIDLHTHSTVSDGTESPAQVMQSARAAGLDVVALTDHDAMDGWDEAAAEAALLGLEFVPGIEVSCRHKRGVDPPARLLATARGPGAASNARRDS